MNQGAAFMANPPPCGETVLFQIDNKEAGQVGALFWFDASDVQSMAEDMIADDPITTGLRGAAKWTSLRDPDQRDKELAAVRATIVSDGAKKYDLNNPLDHLPGQLRETVRANLKRFLEDEKEITRCTEKIKEIAGAAVTAADCRKMAMATKCYLIAKAPRQQAINTITSTHPAIISAKLAADIFDALNEPPDTFYSFLESPPVMPERLPSSNLQTSKKYCVRCNKLYTSEACPICAR